MDSEIHTNTELRTLNKSPQNVCIEVEVPNRLHEYLNSVNFNIQTVCRICLTIDAKEMYPLLSSSKDTNILADVYTGLTSIQIGDDGLPKQICSQCQLFILKCYEFKIQSEKAYYILKTTLRSCSQAGEPSFSKNRPPSIVTIHEANIEITIKKEPDTDEASHSSATTDIRPYDIKKEIQDDNQDNLFTIQNQITSKQENIEISFTEESKNMFNSIIKNDLKQGKYYKCPSCIKKFYKFFLLAKHVKEEHHTGSDFYSCDLCEEFFYSQNDIKAHVTMHAEGFLFKCSTCGKHFLNRKDLRHHSARIHRKKERHPCGECGQVYSALRFLKKHEAQHASGDFEKLMKRHECHLCKERYATTFELATHIRSHGVGNPFQCEHCLKEFVLKKKLIQHMRIHTSTYPFKCSYCDKNFRIKPYLQEHLRVHTGEQPFECKFCGTRFTQRSSMCTHIRNKHTNPISRMRKCYNCPSCIKIFLDLCSLEKHRREEHNTESKLFFCEHNCVDVFNSQHDLDLHMALHKGSPWICPNCQKVLLSKRSLRSHLNTHMETNKYTCSYCGQSFAFSSILVRHVQCHERGGRVRGAEELYQCSLCDQKFRTKRYFEFHKRKHVRMAYACKVCGKEFRKNTTYTLHMSTHTGDKLFECDKCTSKFKWRKSLINHIKAMHP